MRVVVVLFLMILGANFAEARPRNPLYGEPSDFLGTWHNAEVRKTQVIRIVIKPAYGDRICVIVYGLHNGEPTKFGEFTGKFYLAEYQKEREQDNSAIHVWVDREFVRGHVLLRFNKHGEIVSHALLTYGDHHDVYSVERFGITDADYRDDYPRDRDRDDYPRVRDDYPRSRQRPYWRSHD